MKSIILALTLSFTPLAFSQQQQPADGLLECVLHESLPWGKSGHGWQRGRHITTQQITRSEIIVLQSLKSQFDTSSTLKWDDLSPEEKARYAGSRYYRILKRINREEIEVGTVLPNGTLQRMGSTMGETDGTFHLWGLRDVTMEIKCTPLSTPIS